MTSSDTADELVCFFAQRSSAQCLLYRFS